MKFKHFDKPFSDYRTKVDSFFNEGVNYYRELINWTIGHTKSAGFYNAIFYLVNSFLDNNNDYNQLFIQLPCEDLGRTKSEQKENRSILQHIIAETIMLSTADFYDKYKAPSSIQDCEEGSLYCMGSKVLNPNDNTERERVWKVILSQDKTKKLLSEQLPDKKRFLSSQAEAAYQENNEYTFRLKDSIELCDTPKRKDIQLHALGLIANKLSIYRKLKSLCQYKNALIVCYDDTWEGTIIKSNLIESPIEAVTKFDYSDEKYDIVVFIGNRKYLPFKDRIMEKIAYGDVSKVIYIGTDIFNGYDEQANTIRYSFSFREIYSYFNYKTSEERGVFPYVKIKLVRSEWLIQTKDFLEDELLKCSSLSPEDRSQVLSYALYPFLGLDIDFDSEKNVEKLNKFILDNIDMSYEDLDNFASKYATILCPEKTAKQKVLNNLRSKHYLNNYLIISNHRTYKDQIRQFISNKGNKHNNRIFIDVKGDWLSYVEILRYLLQKGYAGHFYFLSYVKLDLIVAFMNEEIKIYKAKYRKDLLNGLVIDIDDNESSIDIDGDLASFYKPLELDDYFAKTNIGSTQSSCFALIDRMGQSKITTGDVIIESSSESLQELFKLKDEYLPASITYYETPSNFQYLMKLKYSFPQGRDIEYYSSVWKNALVNYCTSKYHGKYKEMELSEFPYLKNLRSYLNKKSNTKFPEHIDAIVRKLLSLELISRDDAMYIRAANRANRQNSKNGIELKKALYDYKLYDQKNKILQDIESAALRNGDDDITSDSIMDSSLVTVYITDITKISNKNNNE